MRFLITGTAGFIGFNLARRLLAGGHEVQGVDALTPYYDVELKKKRHAALAGSNRFTAHIANIEDAKKFEAIHAGAAPDVVVHLAAQAGVRYSLENPAAYVHSNLLGFTNVLEACRRRPPKHLVYASSSSVYGAGARPPFAEDANTDQPLSFYGATKKCNEVMAHSYAHLHGLSVTGLRFFTVYGPWGRPDMAPTIFARAISEGRPLTLFNQGKNLRDFTYVDDIVDGLLKVLLHPPVERPTPPCRIFNLGHNRPVETLLFVRMLERLLGRPALIELTGPQPGDMRETCADLTCIHAAVGYKPQVPLEEGLRRFVAWYRSYYGQG
jgi:UDP-glucuronate 4-epimerase